MSTVTCPVINITSSVSQEWYFVGDNITATCSINSTDLLPAIEYYNWIGPVESSATTSPTVSVNTSKSGTFFLTCSVQFKMFITVSGDSNCTSSELAVKIKGKFSCRLYCYTVVWENFV